MSGFIETAPAKLPGTYENNALAASNVRSARLPETYENARTALASCERLDECKDWADKAEALASYARMADDDELYKMAVRIKSRAIRRAGELLEQVESATGAHRKSDAADTLSRKKVAQQAGLSKRQAVTAIRVAKVPEREFNKQVDGPTPPTVTALAKQGTTPRRIEPEDWLKGRSPKDYNLAIHFVADVEAYAERSAEFDVAHLVTILTDEDRKRL
ncbi:MAG: hypothetical protein KDA99_26065, partial [Planctomycetales bacterium]|nr:hypothetical protein [Planctomycetales bacterium]